MDDAVPPQQQPSPKDTAPKDAACLRLLAEDAEDLQIISAALQDAVAKVGDIHWEQRGRVLTIEFNRFRWEAGDGRVGERVRAGLQFGGVLGVQARKLRRDAPEAVIELLTIDFEPAEAPGGAVVRGPRAMQRRGGRRRRARAWFERMPRPAARHNRAIVRSSLGQTIPSAAA